MNAAKIRIFSEEVKLKKEKISYNVLFNTINTNYEIFSDYI